MGNNRRDLAWLLGLIASIIAIFTFATGRQSMDQLVNLFSPPVFQSQGVNVPSPTNTSRPTTENSPSYTFDVDARFDWQETGIQVASGQGVQIAVIEGQWTDGIGVAPFTSGNGWGYQCGYAMNANACVEPMPYENRAALIGQIEDWVFHIGRSNTITANNSGVLALRINDDPLGMYDNDGTLKVRITLTS